MSRSIAYALVLIAASLTILSGVLQGRISGRWGASKNNQQIVERLVGLPEQVGDWKLRDSHEMSEAVQNMLECQGYIYHDYVNQVTGEMVSVVVLLGPHGPISVHTPEICYSSRDFTARNERASITIQQPDGPDSEFPPSELWSITFLSNRVGQQLLRVYYGWTNDGHWQAAANPRVSFIGSPFLLKIQLATILPADVSPADVSPADVSPADDDAGRRFLSDFVPLLRQQLFPAT